MKLRNLVLLAALGCSQTSFATQPFGSHQAEAIVRAPGSSGSVVGVEFLRPAHQAASPAIALTAPTGFGASWGDWMLGLGGSRFEGSLDGSAYLGFGIGNARETVGFESVLNVISVSDDLFKEDSFSFKLHKNFNDRTAIAIGIEHTLRHGDTVAPEQSYHYLAVTQVFHLPLSARGSFPMLATVGYGDGRFGEVDQAKREYVDSNAFAAFSFMPHPRYSLNFEWLGEEFNLGVSVVPIRKWPMTVTVAGLDVTKKHADSITLGVAVGWVF